jgi:prolipoprotein diacylglyceryltransferase
MRPSSLYLLLWTLGCITGFVAALVVLHRRRVLTPATALVIALAWLFLFIGSKWHSRFESLPLASALTLSPVELLTPGRRLPLGLLTSGVAAALACLAFRLPWRHAGDALAVFWSVLIPIGRIGCMTYGCCLGTVCPSWLRPLGWCYGPGSEAFHLQLATGLIPPTSTLSLPVHPLPLYFALASLGTLAAFVWLLRRDAPPGTLLLVFCLVRPATKLALEPLRAEPALPWLMIGIPATTLAIAVTIGLALVLRRLRLGRARRLATAMLLAFMLAAPSASAEEQPWAEALQKYAQNPLRHRRHLRRLEREGRDDHPPVVLLALADARLRAGNFAAADRLFAQAMTANPDEPFATWAVLGRTWARLLAGDVPALPAAEQSPVAAVLRGLVEASHRGTNGADDSFAQVAEDPRASPALRAAAALCAAYARYWRQDDDGGAIAAFDAAVAAADGDLIDDARYGAARARLRAGDIAAAQPMLRELAAWHANGRPGPTSPALIALEWRALLRAGFERYRRGPVRTPEQQVVLMLNGDGAALARAALRDLGEAVPEPRVTPRPKVVPAASVPLRPTPPVVQVRVPEEPRQSPASLEVISAWLRRLLLAAAVLVVLLIAHTWWWDRWIPRGGRHEPL